ncbi:MAG: uroporphyrinogen-III C-methyltransferase [Proteobacteria bacterium]|jgi:uroporphyrin-3 C-methyltransferase|nr:uroporphyrinogen-III C-methyltransferase [Pseudomonadota bacterium]MCG6935876.1 uroporphyrinogen-III C-methyltransferase [Pseudomonadota bacterium]
MTDHKKPDHATPPASKSAKADRAEKKVAEPATPVVEDTPTANKPRRKRRRPGALALYLAQLALLSALLVSGGVIYLWQANEENLASLRLQLAQLNASLNQSVEQQEQFGQAVRGEIGTLNERQQVLLESIDDLTRSRRYLKQDWLVAEANYLVNLAGEQLSLNQNVKTALAALQAADVRLREAGDPSLLPVRKALADDIIALEAVKQPDISGLSLKLSALEGKVDELPLLTPEPASDETQTDNATAPNVEDWKELPAAMWNDIRKLIIIRDHQGPIKPLLSPKQHFFLDQNLKLQLEQARLALLSGEDSVYHERLATAEKWIRTWFDVSDNRTRHMLAVIAELDAQNIHPTLPGINGSYQALKAYREAQAQPRAPREATPPVPDTSTPQVPL